MKAAVRALVSVPVPVPALASSSSRPIPPPPPDTCRIPGPIVDFTPLPPGFSYFVAYKRTPQLIPINVITPVSYRDIRVNRNNEYNMFSSQFTATRAGLYKFCAQAKLRGTTATTSGSASLFLVKNGVQNIRQLGVAGVQGTSCVDLSGCGTQIFLNPGETITVAIFATTSQAITIESGYFEGARES